MTFIAYRKGAHFILSQSIAYMHVSNILMLLREVKLKILYITRSPSIFVCLIYLLLAAADENVLFVFLLFPDWWQKIRRVKKPKDIILREQDLGSSAHTEKGEREKFHDIQGNAIELTQLFVQSMFCGEDSA